MDIEIHVLAPRPTTYEEDAQQARIFKKQMAEQGFKVRVFIYDDQKIRTRKVEV